MGVYIKDGISRTEGKDMPENCLYDCRLVNSCLHVPRWADAETLDNLKVQRADNCPLVEVPEPHGRLIDADAFFKDICDSLNQMTDIGIIVDGSWLWAKLNDAMANAPTIIERSE